MPSVLVVDDDLDILALLRGWLEDEGFDVTVATGAAEGSEALTRAPFDVVVLDLFLPDASGLDAIKLFRARAPTVPLIAI